MVLYSVEAVALRGPCRVCMIDTEISNTFLESSDIVLSLVPDQNWYLKVDQISPTLKNSLNLTNSSRYSSIFFVVPHQSRYVISNCILTTVLFYYQLCLFFFFRVTDCIL